jgi:hypothetical protein
MDRRRFLSVAAGAAAAPRTVRASRRQPVGTPSHRASMVVGSQRAPTDARMLQFFKRHGVDHICG